MKRITQTLYLKFLAACMALLGFSACNEDGPDEYGSPYADYKIVGKVVSSENSGPVEDIRVVFTYTDGYDIESSLPANFTSTDKEGQFEFSTRGFAAANIIIANFEDVDGEKNGEFMNKSVNIKFEESDYKGGNGWYLGKAEKNAGTVKLSSKPTGPEGGEDGK